MFSFFELWQGVPRGTPKTLCPLSLMTLRRGHSHVVNVIRAPTPCFIFSMQGWQKTT